MSPPNPSSLTDHLGYWLRYVSNHVSYAFAQKLEGQGVTSAEWVLLRALYGRAGMAPSRLADELGMTRGAISKLSDRLIEKALIQRGDNPADRRAHTLALSPAGQALVPGLAELADQNDEEFFGHLDPNDRETVDWVLRDIVERRGLKSVPVT